MVLMGKSSIKFYKCGNHPNLIIQMAAQFFPTAAWHQKTLKKHQETLHGSTTTLLCHLGTGFLFSQVAPWCPSNVWFIDKLPRDGQEMPGTPKGRRSKMVKKFSRSVAVESHVFFPSEELWPAAALPPSEDSNFRTWHFCHSFRKLTVIAFFRMISTNLFFWWTDWL